MKQTWLYLNRSDILTERRQCEEEGRDLTSVEAEFDRVLSLDLENLHNQPAAQSLLDQTIQLPLRADYAYQEPSDLEGIRAARPAERPLLPAFSLPTTAWEDKLYGAWAGRVIGCLLGKPVEGWRRPRMWGYLKDTGRYPLKDFFRYDAASPEVRERYDLDKPGAARFMLDRVTAELHAAPEDDDTNYTTTALALFKQYGAGFTPNDVATFWMNNLPLLHTCTAERIAYRNLSNLIPPPDSAMFRNPYREWIGAQIRADFWGYAAPGNPALAAEYAWRDASISHVKNGIYGEMWVAAMTAAAFVTDDLPTILRAGLAEIPAHCRLTDYIEQVLEWQEVEVEYDTAVYRIHEIWDEERAHDWCHTISNAMIVAIGLLWGEKDYATSICRAVHPCFDTDCNGATVGSILGILHGRKALPAAWMDPIEDTLHTGVTGYHTVRLSDLAQETLRLVEKQTR